MAAANMRRAGWVLSCFFVLWWMGLFAGVFGKIGASLWCFCGEFVVECMVKLVN
jgi:hypothetical protein